VAGVTGLEPAASGVTGRRSNQLSYTPSKTRACLVAVVAWFFYRTTPKMLLIRQEFKKNDPASLLRQTSITPKQHKQRPATSSAIITSYILGNIREWWVVRGSNPRPTRCKRVALPAELTTLFIPASSLAFETINNADPYIGPAPKKID
jgi:hypothetical protein